MTSQLILGKVTNLHKTMGNKWFSYNSYYLGPMAGTATPNLNAAKLFMRGSSDESAGTVEDDSVQDHQHADPGHTHSV